MLWFPERQINYQKWIPIAESGGRVLLFIAPNSHRTQTCLQRESTTDMSSSSSSVAAVEGQGGRKAPARAGGGVGKKGSSGKRSVGDTAADDPKVGSKRGVQQVQTPEIPVAKVSKSKCYYQRLPAVLCFYNETNQRMEQWIRENCSQEDFETIQQFLSDYRKSYLSQVETRCFMHFMRMRRDAEYEANKVLDRYDLMMMARIRQYMETVKQFEQSDDYAVDWERLSLLWSTIQSFKDAPPDLASATVMSALGNPRTIAELDIAIVKLAMSGTQSYPSSLLEQARARTRENMLTETEMPETVVKHIVDAVDADLKREETEGRPELWCDLRSIENVRHLPVLRTVSDLLSDLGVRD